MEDFKQVRDSLIDMLEELDERLEKITNDAEISDETVDEDFHLADTETASVPPENKAYSEIEKIKQAISQIDAGSYGICLQCGQPIKKEQLTTSPFSRKCIHCEKKEE